MHNSRQMASESARSFVLFMAFLVFSFVTVMGGFGYLAYQDSIERAAWWEKHNEQWRGAVIVRVCRDGTRIYRLRGGTLTTRNAPVEGNDPNAVCQ